MSKVKLIALHSIGLPAEPEFMGYDDLGEASFQVKTRYVDPGTSFDIESDSACDLIKSGAAIRFEDRKAVEDLAERQAAWDRRALPPDCEELI